MAAKSLYDPTVRFTTPDGRLNPEKNLLAQMQREELEQAQETDAGLGHGAARGIDPTLREAATGMRDGRTLPEAGSQPDYGPGPGAPEAVPEIDPVTGLPKQPGVGSDGLPAGAAEGVAPPDAPVGLGPGSGASMEPDGLVPGMDGVEAPEDGEPVSGEETPAGRSRAEQPDFERAREQIEMAQRMAAQVRLAEAQREYVASGRDEAGREGLGMISPAQMGYEITASAVRAQGADSRISHADEQVAKALETADRVQQQAELQGQAEAAGRDMSYLEYHADQYGG